ncbi:MAG: hypothetical protein VXX80_10615, partial [Bacteroidota bacterium]|nr:hypothetical protein [Bacteroidota bacterium]
ITKNILQNTYRQQITTQHKKNKSMKTLQTKQKKHHPQYHSKKTSNHASITNKIKSNTTRQTFNNNHTKSSISCITNKNENNGNN